MRSVYELLKPDSANRHGRIWAVVLMYAVFAASWILISDQLIHRLFSDPDHLILASMLKGWLYVLVTSGLLYVLMRRWFGGNAVSECQPFNSRQPILVVGVLVAAVFALMATIIFHTFNRHKLETLSRIFQVADMKQRHVGDWLKERLDDAGMMRDSEFLAEHYRLWRESGDSRREAGLKNRLEQFRKGGQIAAISLLSPQGERLWASDGAPVSLAPGALVAAASATATQQVQAINPYRDGNGRVLLDFAVPLAAKPITAPVPVVILHIDLANWLFPILKIWPGASTSGESLLLRRDGNDVHYLSPLRFRPDAAAGFVLPLATQKLLAGLMLNDLERLGTVLEGLDYRGVPVIGVAKAIGGTDWLLLLKLDKSELYETARSEVVWIGCAGALTILLVGLGFYLLRQNQGLMLARAVHDAQVERLRALELLSTIADLSTDAIFAKDLEGRYIMFNTAASRFVGKPAEEILGLDDTAIFPPEQAKRLSEFGRRVMAENITLTEEEHLDTVDGAKVFLATKGPLRDAEGKVTGMFGISRDISGRKQAEVELSESEARFRGLVEQSLAGIYIIQDNRFVYVNPGFAAIFGYREAEEIVSGKTVIDLVSPQDRDRVLDNLRRRLQGEITGLQYSFTGLHRDGHCIEVEVHGRSFEYQGRPAVIGFLLDITARKAAEEALKRQAEELKGRNEELERFNRAMVGRELDMIKLKQTVNQLSIELGRTPPYASRTVEETDPSVDGNRP